jgi:hypothetical protein
MPGMIILARAKDANGRVQPDRHDQHYGRYVITHPLPIEVFVENPTDTPGKRDSANARLVPR